MRMRKRDPGSAPNTGDRVPYVMIQKGRNAKAYEMAEDPIYVLENGLPLNTSWYLNNQLSKPLLRIFEHIIPNAESVLLRGDHTRTVFVATGAVGKKGLGMMRFAKIQKKCVGCGSLLKNRGKGKSNDGSPELCEYCMESSMELYLREQANLKGYERHYNKLWTQCQRCQGSLHQDVLCSNNDCPIFYMRTKAQKDLKIAQDKLAKFSLDW